MSRFLGPVLFIAILAGSARATPQITSFITADPKPCIVNQSVTFSEAATSSNNSALTYVWDFGDGTTASGATVTHVFATVGVYDIQVKISDSTGSIYDYASVAAINTDGLALKCYYSAGKGKMYSTVTGADTITISGVIPESPLIPVAAGQPLTFNFGGLLLAFTLGKTASAKDANGNSVSAKLPKKAGTDAKFKVSLKKQSFYPLFLKAGYAPIPDIRVSQTAIETELLFVSASVTGHIFINVTQPKPKTVRTIASIIPTPSLLSSSVCGTTGVRCAADAN